MADRSTKYIAYCRARCAPRLGAEAALLLQNHYVSIRSDVRARSKDGSNSTVPITVRQLEAIVRISESLAKMTLNRNVRVLFVLFYFFFFLFFCFFVLFYCCLFHFFQCRSPRAAAPASAPLVARAFSGSDLKGRA